MPVRTVWFARASVGNGVGPLPTRSPVACATGERDVNDGPVSRATGARRSFSVSSNPAVESISFESSPIRWAVVFPHDRPAWGGLTPTRGDCIMHAVMRASNVADNGWHTLFLTGLPTIRQSVNLAFRHL